MNETTQYQQYELDRTKGRSVRFTGEEIAGVSGKWQNGKEQNRWTVLTLYRTKGGKYILEREYITQWQGESGNRTVTVCQSAESVIYALVNIAETIHDQITVDAESLVGLEEENMGELESELLRRARAADPAFGRAAVEDVD